MSRVIVLDTATGDGGRGLYLSKGDVSCWRHDVRAEYAGFWQVFVNSLSSAAQQVLGWPDTSRAAVVDDFGNLVVVGDPS